MVVKNTPEFRIRAFHAAIRFAEIFWPTAGLDSGYGLICFAALLRQHEPENTIPEPKHPASLIGYGSESACPVCSFRAAGPVRDGKWVVHYAVGARIIPSQAHFEISAKVPPTNP